MWNSDDLKFLAGCLVALGAFATVSIVSYDAGRQKGAREMLDKLNEKGKICR